MSSKLERLHSFAKQEGAFYVKIVLGNENNHNSCIDGNRCLTIEALNLNIDTMILPSEFLTKKEKFIKEFGFLDKLSIVEIQNLNSELDLNFKEGLRKKIEILYKFREEKAKAGRSWHCTWIP